MSPIESKAADAAQPEKRKVGRASPLRKPLPTDRINIPKQFEIVRAFAAVSGPERRPVSNKQASEVVGITAETLSLGNTFLVEIGVLEKPETGLVPSAEALAFKTASEMGEERPESRLSGLIRKSWFFDAIRPKLEFQSMTESAVVTELAISVHAEKADLPRVRALIDYLSITGVVTRENGTVTLVRAGQPPPPPPNPNMTKPYPAVHDLSRGRQCLGAVTI